MNNGANNFTAERVAELRKNINFSDIPEIKDFSSRHLRNWKPAKKAVPFALILITLNGCKVLG